MASALGLSSEAAQHYMNDKRCGEREGEPENQAPHRMRCATWSGPVKQNQRSQRVESGVSVRAVSADAPGALALLLLALWLSSASPGGADRVAGARWTHFQNRV